MSALSDFLEKKFIDHALGVATFTPASSLELRLYTASPADAGGGTEVTGGDYDSITIANDLTNFPLCSDTGTPTKTNGVIFQFPTASAAWGNVTHWAIYGGTDMYCYGTVSPTNYVSSGDMPKFDPGKLTIQLTNSSAGGLSAATRRKLLDLAFGKATYTKPDAVYVDVGTFSGETFLPSSNSDSSFARAAITFSAASSPAGTTSNSAAVQLSPGVTLTPLSITSFAIYDDGSSGTMIASGSISTPRSPGVGEIVQFNPGGFVLTIQ